MNNFFNNFINFYNTKRLAFDMSDEGGPFGFDIHHALEINFLIEKYQVDCIVETGTNSGDTTEYLCKSYPNITVVSCETNNDYFSFAYNRLKDFKNLFLFNESSEITVKNINKHFQTPLFYFDAHWNDYWPLADEISNVEKGIVCVGDFKNPFAFSNDPEVVYGYDGYNGIDCDFNFIRHSVGEKATKIYTNNVTDDTVYEFPSLQRKKRSGRCYFEVNLNRDFFKESNYFLSLDFVG